MKPTPRGPKPHIRWCDLSALEKREVLSRLDVSLYPMTLMSGRTYTTANARRMARRNDRQFERDLAARRADAPRPPGA